MVSDDHNPILSPGDPAKGRPARRLVDMDIVSGFEERDLLVLIGRVLIGKTPQAVLRRMVAEVEGVDEATGQRLDLHLHDGRVMELRLTERTVGLLIRSNLLPG
jgi:hypothetical protein